MSAIQEEKKIPIREAREIVKDLMMPNAFIYWVDFYRSYYGFFSSQA